MLLLGCSVRRPFISINNHGKWPQNSCLGVSLHPLVRVTTQVEFILHCRSITFSSSLAEYKEAFALFDKKGTGTVPRETLGDLLRALGQNPTQAEVADIVTSAPRDGKQLPSCNSPIFDLLRS